MAEEWDHCGKPLHEFKRVKLPRGTADSHHEFKIDLNRHRQGRSKKAADPEAIKQELMKSEARIAAEAIRVED